MKTITAITCKKGECISVDQGVGSVRCLNGMLWITCYGCMEDYILSRDEELAIAGMRGVVIQALEDSSFSLE